MPFRLRMQSLSRTATVLLVLAGTGGCDRGSHPEQLGRPAPPFAVNDGQRAISLHALRGQVVVLNFWASWCAPCLAEFPSLEALQQQLPQIKVIGIAFDEDLPTYQAYLQRHPLPFPTFLDISGTIHTNFATFRPPETYFLDKNGTIRRKFIGAQDWTSPDILATLQHLADEPAPASAPVPLGSAHRQPGSASIGS